MCGRYSLSVPTELLARTFQLASLPQLELRYNIAPSQLAPVIRVLPGENVGGRHLHLLQWGLIPSWADDPKIGNRMINARAETAPDKPAFRSAFRKRRCLIPADAFYEWQKLDPSGKRKQPYLIKMKDGRPFAFAGLWERWRGEGEPIESFTILTTDPNDVTRPLHNRMPAIVDERDYDTWLDPNLEDAEALKQVLKPAAAEQMTAHPVSTRVNSPSNDDADCVKPFTPPAATGSASKPKPVKMKKAESEGEFLF